MSQCSALTGSSAVRASADPVAYTLTRPAPHRSILFAHAPKTGGNWARVAMGLSKVLSAHGPPYECPWLVASHQVVTHIRDPWGWYASLYAHLVALDRGRELRQWGNGDSTFEAVLRGWTHPDQVTDMPSPPGVVWTPYGPGPHPPMTGGLWSWTYQVFLRDHPATLVDLARVAEGWALLLGSDPSEHPTENRRASAAAVRALYTKTSRAWVRAADRELIDHCGYQFLRPAKHGPLISWPR